MKTLLSILIAILFTGVSYAASNDEGWPHNRTRNHFKTPTGFNYKKLYKNQKRNKRKRKQCPMLSDIR